MPGGAPTSHAPPPAAICRQTARFCRPGFWRNHSSTDDAARGAVETEMRRRAHAAVTDSVAAPGRELPSRVQDLDRRQGDRLAKRCGSGRKWRVSNLRKLSHLSDSDRCELFP